MNAGTGRYSKVTRRIWNDAEFRELSAPEPNAQTLFFRLITAPELGCIPGVFQAWDAGLAQSLEWPLEGFRKAFQELIDKGFVRVDSRSGLVWLPNALKHNQPENPNVIKGWKLAWTELPDSDLKKEIAESFVVYARNKGKKWSAALEDALGDPSPKGSRKGSTKGSRKSYRKQEQEQEQEYDDDKRARDDSDLTPSGPIPCPPDLELEPGAVANLRMAGLSEVFINRGSALLRTRFANQEPRTRAQWLSSLARALSKAWNNPSEKNEFLGVVTPIKPRRGRSPGPIQPNSKETDEEFLARLGRVSGGATA